MQSSRKEKDNSFASQLAMIKLHNPAWTDTFEGYETDTI